MRKPAMILLSALLASGCAERSGCPSQELRSHGFAEGQAGQAATLPGPQCELSEAERDRYFLGRAEGLRDYCQVQRGFDQGVAGVELDPEVCPLDAQVNFRSAWRAGRAIADAEKRQRELLKEAEKLELTAEGLAEVPARAILDQANARRQDARQAENDLEALRGLAIVQGWQPAPDAPPAAFPEEQSSGEGE